ncbi:FAD-dependent oxidoreductase [Kribbella sp. NPDC051587]|uniref:FAD-dependent oxidoreductase n=1 Tax=Kribbella sp. NPDC051587 TaxID=3364119 RepID=UPI0037B7FA4A
MNEAAIATFEQLNLVWVPDKPQPMFDTACVMGGSIAGLLAARVLANYARHVVVLERERVGLLGSPRIGVPQDRHGHVLLPGGLRQFERWLPGLAAEAVSRGGYLAGPSQQVVYYDGVAQAPSGPAAMLLGSRPFLEARIRDVVTSTPNIYLIHGEAAGLTYGAGGRVNGVRFREGLIPADLEGLIPADLVVDAMGRGSNLSSWLDRDGYERPRLQRVKTGINYATACFERIESADVQEIACVLELFRPRSMPHDLTVAHLSVVENDQWLVMLMSYDDHPAARSLQAFRAACDQLPPIFGEASSGNATRQIETFHQADSRRRDFLGLSHFPGGLLAVGDAVASFNPIYGQGMSSAALHASCLAEYLSEEVDVSGRADRFFALQQVVTDAAWTVSAGGDQARLDLVNEIEVPDEVAQRRWALGQIVQATLTDEAISETFRSVTGMEAHPAVLADPLLIQRAIAVNSAAEPDGTAR